MKQNIDKDTLKNMLKDYLTMKGLPTTGSFPCINPKHAESCNEITKDIDSMHYGDTYKRVYCPSCRCKYDIFDVIGIEYNLTHYLQKKAKAEEIYIRMKNESNVMSDTLPTSNGILAEIFQEEDADLELIEPQILYRCA